MNEGIESCLTPDSDLSCPCGTGKLFSLCCEPFLTGNKTPATAEQLMRSRYSAFVTLNSDYLWSTDGQRLPDGDSGTRRYDLDAQIKWLSLEIIDKERGAESDEDGVVEFEARFENQGVKQAFRECSQFIKKDDKWFYVSGEVGSIKRQKVAKVGRNAPCPCGSGKKYKKCCA